MHIRQLYLPRPGISSEGYRTACNAFAALLLSVFGAIHAASTQAQSILRVPLNHASIQAAINAAGSGDIVLVAPGVYVENINFLGKAITVASEAGANVTVIDGNNSGSVVTFTSGESTLSKLTGFTVRNGTGNGSGIRIFSSSPTVKDNIIISNKGCSDGQGVHIENGSPLIQQNVIAGNTQSGCSGGQVAGGISIAGSGSAQILDNVISGNSPSGIALYFTQSPLIRGNIISDNVSDQGGGISIRGSSDAAIIQNLVIGNRASSDGGGIYWQGSQLSGGALLQNNTIADNDGPGISAFLIGTPGRILNNVIVAKPGQTAVICPALPGFTSPIFQFNDVYAPSGTNYLGNCQGAGVSGGNISANATFVNPALGDYRISGNSPAIDTASNTTAPLPTLDIYGNVRVRDGDGNGVATVDMGAYEFTPVPAALTVTMDNGDLGTITSGINPISRPVTIFNASSGVIPVVLSAVAGNDTASFVLAPGGQSPCASLSPTLAPGATCTMLMTFTPGSGGVKSARVVVMFDGVGSPAITGVLSATVPPPDTIPDIIGFTTQTGVAFGGTVTSNSVTISGINVPVPISISGGQYSINGGAYTANPGTIVNGQTLSVRLVAASQYNTTTIATITVGSATVFFSATTLGQAVNAASYYPLTLGNNWTVRRNGVDGSLSIANALPINGAPTVGLLDTFDGSTTYFSNDALGLRLHRVSYPPTFIGGCGTAAENDTYSPPVTLISANGTVGQTINSSGTVTVDMGACGTFAFGYSASSVLEAIEQIAVPAGQFAALKVNTALTVAGIGSQTITNWFVAGVGPVKTIDSEGVVHELTSTNLARTTPDSFGFAAQTNLPPNSTAISNAITISGITAPAPVSISGGEFSVNFGGFTSQLGTATNGQTVRVRLTAPAQPKTTTTATLTVGGATGVFSVTSGLGTPAAPTAVSAISGHASIRVSFVPPTNDGGTAITGYTANCTSPEGGVPVSKSVGFGETSVRVTGLSSGKRYTCNISATNNVGIGPQSASSNSVKPFDLTPILQLLLD